MNAISRCDLTRDEFLEDLEPVGETDEAAGNVWKLDDTGSEEDEKFDNVEFLELTHGIWEPSGLKFKKRLRSLFSRAA